MSINKINEMIINEWRKLGFYYECDDNAKEWQLWGSRTGLLCFRDLLVKYASNQQNDMKSEHDHYGPYGYLEIMTWPTAGMDGHSIFGPLSELHRLAKIVEDKLENTTSGDIIRIKHEYSIDSEYTLVIFVRGAGFDPASADGGLQP
jgi:hypothetical protein